MTERQSLALDYLKAFGIIAVVTGHYDGSFINFIRAYMFHMPLFFFAGGMLFKTDKSGKAFAENIFFKYVLYIGISYSVLWYLTYMLSAFAPNIEFPRGGVLTQIQLYFQQNFHSLPMFFVSWFLMAYMGVLILARTVLPVVDKANRLVMPELFLAAVAILSGVLGVHVFAGYYAEGKQQIYNYLTQVSVGFMFFLFGYAVRNHIVRWLNFPAFLFAFVALFTMKKCGVLDNLGMSWSVYKQGFVFTAISPLLCIFLLLCVSYWLAGNPSFGLLRNIGRRSKAIMTYHLFIFFLLDSVVKL